MGHLEHQSTHTDVEWAFPEFQHLFQFWLLLASPHILQKVHYFSLLQDYFLVLVISVSPVVEILCQVAHKDIHFKTIISIYSDCAGSLSVMAECPAISQPFPQVYFY